MIVNLSFTANHTIEEITKYIQKYIFEHKNDIEIDQTKGANIDVVKYILCKEKSKLW